MKEKPSEEQIKALQTFAAHNGRTWKSALCFCWETGRYKDFNGVERSDLLQQIRNSLGPSWLTRFRLPEDGYSVQKSGEYYYLRFRGLSTEAGGPFVDHKTAMKFKRIAEAERRNYS